MRLELERVRDGVGHVPAHDQQVSSILRGEVDFGVADRVAAGSARRDALEDHRHAEQRERKMKCGHAVVPSRSAVVMLQILGLARYAQRRQVEVAIWANEKLKKVAKDKTS